MDDYCDIVHVNRGTEEEFNIIIGVSIPYSTLSYQYCDCINNHYSIVNTIRTCHTIVIYYQLCWITTIVCLIKESNLTVQYTSWFWSRKSFVSIIVISDRSRSGYIGW